MKLYSTNHQSPDVDLAEAVLFFLNKKTKENLINIGSSTELTIQEYAKFIIKNLGANLKINYDRSMMDGTPRKILDSSIARKYGWKPKHNLKEGFEKTYNQYINKFKNKKVISVS